MSFEIPSPCVAGIESPPPSNMSSKTSSASSTFLYYTSSTGSLAIPPNGVFKVRRQSPLAQASKRNASALLPPPTRPQRFVQMKPRRQREETANKGRRSSTRVADRKITKNKAHSVVEHRRRVKMNEAFAVMKGLIPACTGEMHKLDILQASIDYIHYLEDCVAKLQAKDSDTGATSRSEQTTSLPLAFSESSSPSRQDPIYHEDVETSDPERLCSSASTDNNGCDFTDPLCTPFTPHPETYSSTCPAPVLGISAFSSALPSQTGLDQEASGPLLMLDIDQQSDNSSVLRRGMSIRDLLT